MIGTAQFNYSTVVYTLQRLKGNDRPFAFRSIPWYIDHHCLMKKGSGLYSRGVVFSGQKCLFIFEEKVFSWKPLTTLQTFFLSHVKRAKLGVELFSGEPVRYVPSHWERLPDPEGKHILFVEFKVKVKFWKSKFTSLLSFEALLTNVALLPALGWIHHHWF